MSSHHSWFKLWARTVGMPIGDTDHDRPKTPILTQRQVKRALILRTFWIVLHVTTCLMIIASNGKSLGLWLNKKENYYVGSEKTQNGITEASEGKKSHCAFDFIRPE